ncbi:TolC family protein, partial [Acinetobacter baumannii]
SLILHHPELDKYRFLDQEAFQDIRIARAAYWPTIDASFSRTWNDQRTDGSPSQKYTVNALALTASWSIFNGGNDYFAVEAA